MVFVRGIEDNKNKLKSYKKNLKTWVNIYIQVYCIFLVMKQQQQKTRNKGMKQNMKSKERCTVYKTFFYAPCLKTSIIQYAYYACKYITCTVYSWHNHGTGYNQPTTVLRDSRRSTERTQISGKHLKMRLHGLRRWWCCRCGCRRAYSHICRVGRLR